MKLKEKLAEEWLIKYLLQLEERSESGVYGENLVEAFQAGFAAAREMAAEYLDKYREAYSESIFPDDVDMEQYCPECRTATAGRMGRFVLDNSRRDIRQLGEGEE